MAQEFFDYVKRDYENAPDWSSVTGKISDDLTQISRDREAKRMDIERQTQEAVDALNQQEMGANQTLNQMVIEGSREATKHLLEQNKLMKQNKIKPEQNLIAMQAQLDDWNTLSNSVKGWNQDYADYMQRMEEGVSAGMEQSMAEWNEEFGNIANKSIIVNPTNGRLYLATKNADGSVDMKPESMTTVNALNNRLKDRVQKYDVNGQVQNQVNKLGQVVKVINKDGILTMDDVRQNPAYKEAKQKMVTALLGTDRDTSSILSDYVGGYSFTRDKDMQGKTDENGNELIYLEPDQNGLFQPKFTEDQKKKAEEYVDLQLEMQLGRIETVKPAERKQTYRPTEGDRARYAKRKEIANIFQTAVDLASGDESARTDALNRVKQYTDISNVVKEGNQWIVEMKDGSVETVQSTGDPELDAKSLFVYTVGDNFKQQYGSTSPQTAYEAWKKGGNVAGELASDFGEREELPELTAYDIRTSDGSTVGDSLLEIFSGKDNDGVKVAKLKRVIDTMNLPKGMEVPTSIIEKVERLSSLQGVQPAQIIDMFNREISTLIEEYNQSLGNSGGSFEGDDIFSDAGDLQAFWDPDAKKKSSKGSKPQRRRNPNDQGAGDRELDYEFEDIGIV